MKCYPIEIDLPCHELGDAYHGLGGIDPVTFEMEDDIDPATGELLAGRVAVPAAEPLQRVRITFKRRNKTFILDSDPAQNPDQLIQIVDPNTWECEIGTISNFLPISGAWRWDADFYSGWFGGKLTLYKGTLNVDA